MNQADKVPRRRGLKRSDRFIPDYDFLFEENATKKRKKSRFFRKLISINRRPLILSSFIYLLQHSPVFVTPIITANIINIVTEAVSSAGDITTAIWNRLLINVIVLAVCILQNVPSTVWRWKVVSKMNRTTSAAIKSSVVRKLQCLSVTYHKDMQTGKIQSKFLKDTDSVDQLMNSVVHSLIPNILGVIIASVISVYNNGIVALFFLLVIPCNVGISYVFRKKIRQSYRDYRLKTEDMSAKLSTMLEMMTVTKSHGLERTELKSFNRTIRKLTGSGLDVDNTMANFGAWMFVVNSLLNATCLVFCSLLAIKKIIGVGDIVLYQSMFSQITGYVSGLIGVVPQISSGMEALNSVSEIMNATDVEVNIGKKSVNSIEGAVEFKNVSYKYPDADQMVIKDFSLSVKPGECIAVVGASGSGKSTIMNLIIGFLKPTEGEVCVDGKSIEQFNLSKYRHNISVVPQSSILFAGTIRENITYGLEHYTEEQLQEVVDMANLNEFINEMPKGIDSYIGEHGDKLSGGQKQRITIARALIRNPRILILDEATSALDNISEYHVQKAIAKSIRGRTTFIVAHRLSTIRDADRIVVMEDGIAVEIGSYDELMEKKGKFYQLKCLNEMNLKMAEEGLS